MSCHFSRPSSRKSSRPHSSTPCQWLGLSGVTAMCSVFPQQRIHAFFSTSLFTFFFFLSFLPFLSLFLNAPIPALHTSAYLTKNASKSSGCTTVDILIFNSLCLRRPLVARMRMGSGCGGCRSANKSIVVAEEVGGGEVAGDERDVSVPYDTGLFELALSWRPALRLRK